MCKSKTKSSPKTIAKSKSKDTTKTMAKSKVKSKRGSQAKTAATFTGFILRPWMPLLAELENHIKPDIEGQKSQVRRTEKVVSLDAAKASKRIADLNLIPASAESLTQLLQLPNMRVTNFAFEAQKGKEYLHLFCEYEYKITICPRCSKTSTAFHEGKDRSVRHLDIWGKPTIIHFTRRRFDCQSCCKPFSEILNWVDFKRRQTCAFEQHIYECLSVHKMSRRAVGLAFGLHEETVLRIFKKKAKEVLRNPQKNLVRVLGVDEIYLGKKNYVLILSDIEQHRVIGILSDRKKATLVKYFKELSQEQRQAIKVVSMDMWRPYRSAVRKQLKGATIVIDRFHVMKQLNHQLDLLRRKLRRDEEINPELSELLKNSRWALLKNRKNLSQKEEEKLQAILIASPRLRRMYLMKEEFRLICNRVNSRKKADRFLRSWLFRADYSGCRYLKKFAKTFRNWYQHFLNYFIERVTQGVVEGLNRAIRGIINRAFGFRKFENFRLHVLAEYPPRSSPFPRKCE